MNFLSINDVHELIRTGKKTALVLRWKGTEKTCGYWPANLMKTLFDIAEQKVAAGEFITLKQAMEHLESITYICTEDDYNVSQEHLH